METMQETLQKLAQAVNELSGRINGKFSDESPRVFESNPTGVQGYVPKPDFPKFDGSNPRKWIKKCNDYFRLCKIDEDQKVGLACLNMIGDAENWISGYVAIKKNVDWYEFIVDLCARFKEEIVSNVVERFNKLSQTGNLECYVAEFEELRSLMLQQNYILPDSYFLDNFVGGLKPCVRSCVKAFRPTNLPKAIEYARLVEENWGATKSNSHTPPKTTSTPKPVMTSPQNLPPLLPTPTAFKPILETPQNISPLLPIPSVFKPILETPQNLPPLFPPLNAFKPNLFPSISVPTVPSPQTTFTTIEKEQKQLQELCYVSDKPFERGDKCQLRQTGLFMVEVPRAEVDGNEGGDVGGYDEGKTEYDQLGQVINLSTIDPYMSSGSLSYHSLGWFNHSKNHDAQKLGDELLKGGSAMESHDDIRFVFVPIAESEAFCVKDQGVLATSLKFEWYVLPISTRVHVFLFRYRDVFESKNTWITFLDYREVNGWGKQGLCAVLLWELPGLGVILCFGKHRAERSSPVGSWVWLKLQPYSQRSLRQDVVNIAYKLKLPDNIQIHLVFHVSQLRKVKGGSTNHCALFPQYIRVKLVKMYWCQQLYWKGGWLNIVC